jgi:hypothetical protein
VGHLAEIKAQAAGKAPNQSRWADAALDLSDKPKMLLGSNLWQIEKNFNF